MAFVIVRKASGRVVRTGNLPSTNENRSSPLCAVFQDVSITYWSYYKRLTIGNQGARDTRRISQSNETAAENAANWAGLPHATR